MGITTALILQKAGEAAVAVGDVVVVVIKATVVEAVVTTIQLTITTAMVIKDKAAVAASTTRAPRTTIIKGPHRVPLKVATTPTIKEILKDPLNDRSEEESHSTLG